MYTATRLLIIISVGLTLTSCVVGPDYQKPDLQTPARYARLAEIEARKTTTSAELDNWWNGFNDPLLTKFVLLGMERNLDLAQAQARVLQSRALLRSANAALLPSASVEAEAAKAHLSVDTPEGRLLNSSPSFDRNGSLYEANLGATWELDLFGGLSRNREAAAAELTAAGASGAAVRLLVAAHVADSYVVIRGLQARLQVARDQLETQRRLVSTIKLQFDAGVASELQLRQVEGALSQVEATIPALQANLEVAQNSFDVLLGSQPGTYRTELDRSSPIPVAPSIESVGGPADLIRRRPDLIVAERRLAASNANIGSAISEYYPKFSLSGLLGTATTSASSLFGASANQAQGVFGLRWRLFDFERVSAQIDAARGKNLEALAAYRLAALKASEDVEDAFTLLVKREQQAAILVSGEIALARARETSMAAYRGGVISLIEVLDSDRRLLSSRDAIAVAQTDAAKAAIASFLALGGGWDPVQLSASN